MTIKDYCKQGNKMSSSFNKAMELAESMLNESETLMYSAIALENGIAGVVVITSKRIYWCAKIGKIGGTKEMYFKDIQSVQTLTDKFLGMTGGGIEIKGGIEIFKISAGNAEVINNIKKAIDNVRMDNITPIKCEVNTNNDTGQVEKKKGTSKLLIIIIIILVMALTIIIGMNNEKKDNDSSTNNNVETTQTNN